MLSSKKGDVTLRNRDRPVARSRPCAKNSLQLSVRLSQEYTAEVGAILKQPKASPNVPRSLFCAKHSHRSNFTGPYYISMEWWILITLVSEVQECETPSGMSFRCSEETKMFLGEIYDFSHCFKSNLLPILHLAYCVELRPTTSQANPSHQQRNPCRRP